MGRWALFAWPDPLSGGPVHNVHPIRQAMDLVALVIMESIPMGDLMGAGVGVVSPKSEASSWERYSA